MALRGGLFGFHYFAKGMTQQAPGKSTPDVMNFNSYWNDWARWDAGWYFGVMQKGYVGVADYSAKGSNVAFFPLYPYLIRAATTIVGVQNHWYAGIAISNLATIFALYFVLRIARRYLDEDGARRALVYILLFPSSFFFSTYYSEGLFLLTTTASFCYYLEKRYLMCGIWGYLAALTRDPGMLLFPSFVLGWLWENRGRITRQDLGLLWLGLIPAGLLTFMTILYLKVGDPLAFLHAHEAWDRRLTPLPVTLWKGLSEVNWSFPYNSINMMRLADLAAGLGFLVLPFFMFRKYDKSLAIYALLGILMPFSSGHVASMTRFVLIIFPAFFVLAQWGENRRVDRWIVGMSAMFLGLMSTAYGNWYFVG